MTIGRLVLRLTVGSVFVGHGTQKLFGWFGGPGLDATAESFEKLGMKPGRPHALAAGLAETGGGALLAVGYATPLAAAALTATMLTAIERVHAKHGLWAANQGYEYNLVTIGALLTLAETGPGTPALGRRRSGTCWAVAALTAGAAGAAAAYYAAERGVITAPEAKRPGARVAVVQHEQPTAA